MPEKLPGAFKIAAICGFLLAGPVTVFAFILGGAYVGAAVVIAFSFFFVILYMIAVRKYS